MLHAGGIDKERPREYTHTHMAVHEDIAIRPTSVVPRIKRDAVYLKFKNQKWVMKNIFSETTRKSLK
jgi:hypothetical protein